MEAERQHPSKYEMRHIWVPLEIKEVGEAGEFFGHASVFGVIDAMGDIVEKGAFKATLRDHKREGTWPPMLLGHDRSKEPGEWIDISEDDMGLPVHGALWLDGPIPDPDALKAYRGMKKKKGKMGLSIGYVPVEEEWDERANANRLKVIDLWEISLTNFPANALARVEQVKAAMDRGEVPEVRYLEAVLRDAGLSITRAKAVLAKGYSPDAPRDVDGATLDAAKRVLGLFTS